VLQQNDYKVKLVEKASKMVRLATTTVAITMKRNQKLNKIQFNIFSFSNGSNEV
jgi:hypothetical protein